MAIRFTAFASVAFAAALVSIPASATPPADGMSTSVRTADLDLASDTGLAALHARIRHAATMVCGGDIDQRDLTAARLAGICRQVAMESAEPQVRVALAAARNGRQLAANDVKVTVARGF